MNRLLPRFPQLLVTGKTERRQFYLMVCGRSQLDPKLKMIDYTGKGSGERNGG